MIPKMLTLGLPLARGEEGNTKSLAFYICTPLIGSKRDFQFQISGKTAERLALPDSGKMNWYSRHTAEN